MTSKVGRPRIEFDLEVVEGLGRIGATIAEMAAILPAAKRTVADRMADIQGDFRVAYERGWSQLKGGLRRKQIHVAMAGNVTMLIWLGKQHLGQQDKVIETQRDMTQLVEQELENLQIRTADDARRLLKSLGVKEI